MSDKNLLRKTRLGIVINATSKKQDSSIIKALQEVVNKLNKKFKVELVWYNCWYLRDIVKGLKTNFPEIEFHYLFDSSNIRPDGGILFMKATGGGLYPILLSEAKNQGTNALRIKEGLPVQAKGNAIERLGKNVIGLRTALLNESIFPFVCFGYGCDFAGDSSILDRVVTIAMFGKLNKTYLHNEGSGVKFNRGSFYFREKDWSVEEMIGIMYDIAERSILYYFSKYGKGSFEEE
jgi:type II restriction enzyme